MTRRERAVLIVLLALALPTGGLSTLLALALAGGIDAVAWVRSAGLIPGARRARALCREAWPLWAAMGGSIALYPVLPVAAFGYVVVGMMGVHYARLTARLFNGRLLNNDIIK